MQQPCLPEAPVDLAAHRVAIDDGHEPSKPADSWMGCALGKARARSTGSGEVDEILRDMNEDRALAEALAEAVPSKLRRAGR